MRPDRPERTLVLLCSLLLAVSALTAAGPTKSQPPSATVKDGALDTRPSNRRTKLQDVEGSLPILAPGEERTVILDDADAQDVLKFDPNDPGQPTTSTKLVEKTLPDGRKVVYEIVDEVVDDYHHHDDHYGLHDENDATEPEAGDEIDQTGDNKSSFAPPKESGNNDDHGSRPTGEKTSAEPDTKADDRPASSNNSTNRQPEQQLAKKPDQEQGKQQQGQLASAPPSQPTKPAPASSEPAAQAPAVSAPAPSIVQPAPAATFNQQIKQQQLPSDQLRRPDIAPGAPTAPSATNGPNEPRQETVKAAPQTEVSSPPKYQAPIQQPNVRIENVGNTVKKLVDNSVVNLGTDAPNEIVIKDSGNQDEDIHLNRKLNKLERKPGQSTPTKSNNDHKQGNDDHKSTDDVDFDEKQDDLNEISNSIDDETTLDKQEPDDKSNQPHESKHQRKTNKKKSLKKKKSKGKSNKINPKDELIADTDKDAPQKQQPEQVDNVKDNNEADGEDSDILEDVDSEEDMQKKTSIEESPSGQISANPNVAPESTENQLKSRSGSTSRSALHVQGPNQLREQELKKSPMNSGNRVIPPNELHYGGHVQPNGQITQLIDRETVVPAQQAQSRTTILQPQLINIDKLKPSQQSSTVLPDQPRQQTTIVPGQQSSLVVTPGNANDQTIIQQQSGSQKNIIQPGLQTETIVQPGNQLSVQREDQPVVIEEKVDTVDEDDGDDPDDGDEEMIELDDVEDIEQGGRRRGRWRRRRRRGRGYGRWSGRRRRGGWGR